MSSQFSQVGGGPTTTTRVPARCFLTICSETLLTERRQNSRAALSLETSSQFTQVGALPAGSLAWRPWRRGAHASCNAECFSQELAWKEPPKRGLVHRLRGRVQGRGRNERRSKLPVISNVRKHIEPYLLNNSYCWTPQMRSGALA